MDQRLYHVKQQAIIWVVVFVKRIYDEFKQRLTDGVLRIFLIQSN